MSSFSNNYVYKQLNFNPILNESYSTIIFLRNRPFAIFSNKIRKSIIHFVETHIVAQKFKIQT